MPCAVRLGRSSQVNWKGLDLHWHLLAFIGRSHIISTILSFFGGYRLHRFDPAKVDASCTRWSLRHPTEKEQSSPPYQNWIKQLEPTCQSGKSQLIRSVPNQARTGTFDKSYKPPRMISIIDPLTLPVKPKDKSPNSLPRRGVEC